VVIKKRVRWKGLGVEMIMTKEIREILTPEQYDYELRVSCFEYHYTVNNPISSNQCHIYNEYDSEACVEIDWNNKIPTKVSELFIYSYYNKIVVYDSDDCFNYDVRNFIIDDTNGLVILV